MDFAWTEEQTSQYQSVVTFAESELADSPAANDSSLEFSRSAWKRCAEFGILGWAIPEALGGSGYPITTTALMMEALGYGCRDNGLSFALGTQMWGLQRALLQFGSEKTIESYLPSMLSGDVLGSFAINEEVSGSDALSLETTATEVDDGFVLTGEKVLVTLAPVADFALVFAVTDKSAGRWGVSAFIVNADSAGYTAQERESMMGLRSVPFGALTLNECWVPREALLGKVGTGATIFSFVQSWERSLLLAPQIGSMQRQLEACVQFVKTRRRGGKPIGKYQAVSHRIADMMIRLETSRLLLYRTAWLFEQGKPNMLEAAITKTYLSEAFVESSREAILSFGGDGYTTDTGVERDLRDAIGGTIYGGTVDVQRNIIAGLLGL